MRTSNSADKSYVICITLCVCVCVLATTHITFGWLCVTDNFDGYFFPNDDLVHDNMAMKWFLQNSSTEMYYVVPLRRPSLKRCPKS